MRSRQHTNLDADITHGFCISSIDARLTINDGPTNRFLLDFAENFTDLISRRAFFRHKLR